MAVDFGKVLDTLKTGVITLAENDLKNYVTQATADGKAIIDGLKADLQTWTTQLEKGEITKGDFEYNVLSQKDSLKMAALEQAGLAEIQFDQFKTDVFNLITNTIIGLIP